MTYAATLTLRDIADLAGVSRPAVSMWRKRPVVRGRRLPFPSPVDVVAGQERFDREQVVAWLDQTGRGNNSEHALDAAAVAVPDEADMDEVILLLCLHALTGEQLAGRSRAALVRLAAETDKEDRLLRREIEALRPDPAILEYADELVGASYGPGDALARLERSRLARERQTRGLTRRATDVVQAVAAACRLHLGHDVALVPDPAAGLLGTEGFSAIYVEDDGDDARALRRRALLTETDTVEGAPRSVRLVSLVGLDPSPALVKLDEATLRLGPIDAAVVLGPASVLADRLTGDDDATRDQTLRSRNLVFAARLPRGYWKGAHRQSLALWVLHGGREADRFRVADLSDVRIDLDELAADVTGALEGTEDRAFRYARTAELPPVLAGTAPVVARGVVAPRLATRTTSDADRVRAASLVTSTPVDAFDVHIGSAPGAVVIRHRSLGELASAGQLRHLRGSRIDPADHDDDGTVRVHGHDGVRLDPFHSERRYGRAARTEPGDVVFSPKERTAHVDEQGGALVASPARILRLSSSAPVGPHTLAAIINQQTSGEWQTWTVPDHLTAEDGLDEALADLEAYTAELERRLRAAHDLRRALIDGVAAGTVSIEHTDEKRAG